MAQTAPIIPETKGKIVYIDNLKVVLTVLVVLHHTFITYGAPGGWYYRQPTLQMGALIPMTLFVAVNQSFFMGFFFFLSALFIPSSYNKKGPAKFFGDRLLRLGVPLLFYSFIFSPVLNYLVYVYGENHHVTFLQFLGGYDDWIDFGVLWFVAALLVFTFGYWLWRSFVPAGEQKRIAVPTNKQIIFFTFLLAIATFLVRIMFPVGWVLHPVGFQLGHWCQYIALFIAGIAAANNKWLQAITYQQGKRMRLVALLMIFVGFPLLFVLKGVFGFSIDEVNGGLHWPSLLYSFWEQITGVCIIVAMLGIGKEKFNQHNPLLAKMSRASFAVYILHPLAIISTALLLKNINIDPAFKLLIAAPIILLAAWALGAIAVRIPGVKNIV